MTSNDIAPQAGAHKSSRSMHSRRRRGARAAVAAGLAVCSIAGSGLLAAAPAQADGLVGACVGPFWGLMQQDLCVQANMGGKNYSNHTQWVGAVSANSPTGFNTFKEVWGDGFYQNGWGVNRTWTINRWVRSGTYICASSNDFQVGDSREVACIAIRV